MLPEDSTGSTDTKLIVIRGPSGAGKSSIARRLQLRHGRGCALVGQDYLRRVVLRERDLPGGIAPALIAQTVRFCLDNGYHVVLEGILHSARHAGMIRALSAAHLGQTTVFYLDIPFEETLRRHAMRPQAAEFGPDQMRDWYAAHDVLGLQGEHIIDETAAMEDIIGLIAATAGLPQTRRDEEPPAF